MEITAPQAARLFLTFCGQMVAAVAARGRLTEIPERAALHPQQRTFLHQFFPQHLAVEGRAIIPPGAPELAAYFN
jgi:hypothetical protein